MGGHFAAFFQFRRVVDLGLALALLAGLANVPQRVRDFIVPILPIVRLWPDPDAQYRLYLGDVPYDLLRKADAVLPRDAVVLLVTPGRDVRHLDYTTFHRALYFLTPRPVWWLSPAPPDGTWESRWWISAPITAESVRAVAAEKHASHVLAFRLPQPLSIGQTIAEWRDGTLYQLNAGLPVPPAPTAPPGYASAAWPIQMILALLALSSPGNIALAVIARMGYRTTGVEALALAWTLGTGLVSIGMFWLNAIGVSLNGQVVILTLSAALHWARNWKGYLSSAQHAWRVLLDGLRARLSWRRVLIVFLLACLILQIALVTLMAVGRPLFIWDSWVTWGMKARTIFLEGHLSPAVYLDPSRAVTHLDYPLLVPLIEAWFYAWLGVPDDRFAGAISILFYLALSSVCYATVRRRGATSTLALGAAVVVASMAGISGWASLVFADVPLAVFATLSALYLIEWLESGSPGTLAIAAASAALMPWTKREGVVLLMALCLASLLISRGARRAWIGVGALVLATLLLAGPWWIFLAWQGIANTDFLPLTVATFQANLDRLPSIMWRFLNSLLSANWSYIWPLAMLFGASLLVKRTRQRLEATVNLLPATAIMYLSLMGLAYVFSAFVPYQQHVASSVDRLVTHTAPLPVLWMVYALDLRSLH